MAALKLNKGQWLNKAFYKTAVEGYSDAVLTLASNTFLRNVMASTVLNAYGVYRASHASLKVTAQSYTAEEQAFLKVVGLLGGAFSAPRDDAVLFKRIVIVTLESVALRYLHAHNRAVPKQTTPFLNHLTNGYPSLNNYYCSLLPTVNAMYAMLASRLDILEGKTQDSASYETLFSLLRERGYLTYMVRGTTASYGKHSMFYPAAYKCDRLVAHEDIILRNPDGLRNGWGLDDSEVYAQTLAMLEQHRDSPICMVVNTIDTHPPYMYRKYTDSAYPEIIQRLASPLLHSLNQMDTDLCFFFGALLEKKLLDDETLIVVCGDHTPGYGPEYQQFTRAADFFPERVPMIFVSNKPSPLLYLNAQMPACSLDFLPTMCDALGLRCPDSAWGRSMFCGTPRCVVRRHNMVYRFGCKNLDISLNVQEPEDSLAHTALVKWINNMRAR